MTLIEYDFIRSACAGFGSKGLSARQDNPTGLSAGGLSSGD